MMTEIDDEKKSVLHIACLRGYDEVITCILQKATEFGILDMIINSEDEFGLTPLYFICLFGFDSNKKNARLNSRSQIMQ
jgi:ankyrin repeat protein